MTTARGVAERLTARWEEGIEGPAGVLPLGCAENRKSLLGVPHGVGEAPVQEGDTGETLEGIIEWYDKICLKVNREGAPNLLIFKPNIKYMYKA